MALKFQTINVPFGQGLAEQAAPSLVAPGKLAQAENGWLNKAGSIEPRPGFAAVPSDVVYEIGVGLTNLTTIHRLIGHGGETLVSNGYRFLSYSESLEKWLTKDRIYEATIAERRQGERGRDDLNAEGDCVYCNGYYAHSWWANGKIHVRFVDATTGVRFPTDFVSTSTVRHRLVTVGAYVHLIFHNVAMAAVYAQTYNTTNIQTSLATPGSTSLGASCAAAGFFDAFAGTSKVYMVYWDGTDIVWRRFTAALAYDAVTGSETVTPYSLVTISAQQGGSVFVAYDSVTGAAVNGVAYFCHADADGSQEQEPKTIDSGIYWTNPCVRAIGIAQQGDSALVVYETWDNASGGYAIPSLRARWVTNGGTLGWGNRTERIGMLSKPIIHEGQPYVVGYYHERSHTHVTQHKCTGYPNRYAYLLHIPTAPAAPLED